MNEATLRPPGWPIPKIYEVLQRIGTQKAKYYAVLDLTSGYFQAPIAKDIRNYTTFITYMGTFRWTRVPMGVKGAPHYFQKQIASEVLAGLMYKLLELYIDDIIVYASTTKELNDRLDILFKRLSKYNITINPKKCLIGLTSIHYLGYTIDELGMTVSKDKTTKLLEMPLPQTPKQLHTFLGLANYFRTYRVRVKENKK